jgi:hypothetical protein
LKASIEQKITTFEQLREAMRIACTDSELGLNDERDDDIENIERRVKAFRHCKKLQALASKNTGYRKMIKQIDKYWEKLFAKQILKEEQKSKAITGKHPRNIRRLFKLVNLPELLMNAA